MTKLELQRHIEGQIRNLLCFEVDISKYISMAIYRTEVCLKETKNKFLNTEKGGISFSVFNSVHNCIFLYQLSRVSYELDGNGINAEKFYYLNKILNSVDIFYEVSLPAVWSAEHPLCSIMGRAFYSDHFFFYQGCTVGGNGGFYPTIGHYVTMYSNSKILGNAQVGNNVIISANTYVKAQNIPDNCIVFGKSPHLVIKNKTKEEIQKLVSHIWI